jgi:hypothetical protein
MSPAALISSQTLIETIRAVRNQKKVIELIEDTVRPLRAEGIETYAGFIRSMRAELSTINPIDVADPEEWSLIQFSRVYLYRLMPNKSYAIQ